MKRILFLLMTILLGMNVSFASEKESKKDAENRALYEEAVEAMKDNKFVIKFHTLDGKRKRIRLDELTNYVVLDGNSVKYQNDNGRRWYRADYGGHLHFPEIYEGEASDIEMNVDKKGNITYSMLMMCKGRAVTHKLKMKITIKKGSNKCEVVWINKRYGNVKSYLYGNVYPIGAAEIRRAV